MINVYVTGFSCNSLNVMSEEWHYWLGILRGRKLDGRDFGKMMCEETGCVSPQKRTKEQKEGRQGGRKGHEQCFLIMNNY